VDATLNLMPCGLIVTDKQWKVIDCNRTILQKAQISENIFIGSSIETIFTRGSQLLCQSIVFPKLLHEFSIEEIQLNLTTFDQKYLPVVINARCEWESSEMVYWILFPADERDKLNQKLLDSRDQLEAANEKLQKLAITDELTGLFNRRELGVRLSSHILQSQRRQSCLTVIMLDVDNFKRVNDEFGHSHGDSVLKQLGRLLTKNLHDGDLAARYGGEEFVLVLPDTDAEAAKILAKRTPESFKKITCRAAPVTASIDVCSIGWRESISVDDILNRADSAMYQAKSSGRNRTCLYNSL
jgi:diguanylate cyclase (GGDEF)-like protein